MNNMQGERLLGTGLMVVLILGLVFSGWSPLNTFMTQPLGPDPVKAASEAAGIHSTTINAVSMTGQAPALLGKIHLPLMFMSFPRANPRIGVEMHSITEAGKLSAVAQTGTHWVRRNGLHWMRVELTEGVYSWDDPYIKAMEAELVNARANRLETILVVRTTPDWARLGKVEITPGGETFDFSPYACGPVAPEKYAAFGSFMYELVKRYSGHPYYVRYFQLGNEPEGEATAVGEDGSLYYGCWGWSARPYFNGESYGDMLAAVYPRVKEANPQAQVVFGGVVMDCNPYSEKVQNCTSRAIDFLEGAIYRHGLRDGFQYFDAVAYHGYDFYMEKLGQYGNSGWESYWDTDGPVILAKGKFIKELLNRYGAGDKAIMNTEGAIMCGRGAAEEYCNGDFELTKAYYLAEYMVAGSSIGLETSIWYATIGWRYSGLFNADGTPTLAYDSFTFATQRLDNAVFSREITQYADVFAYEFKEGSRTTWFLWSKDGNAHTITLPLRPQYIWDVLGSPQAVTGTSITITVKPMYIQW
jgi:hypothetical protein